MRSSRSWPGIGLLAVCSISAGIAAEDAPSARTLCRSGEDVQFSCRIGSKTVSLCATGEVSRISSLAYRFGAANKIENEFVARQDNANRFYATVSPAEPGASVRQVWFDRGDVRYLLTECIGGNCSKAAGLAVLNGDRVLMNARCIRSGDKDLAWFSPKLVAFGADAAGSRSATELLVIEDADNDIHKLYRNKHLRPR